MNGLIYYELQHEWKPVAALKEAAVEAISNYWFERCKTTSTSPLNKHSARSWHVPFTPALMRKAPQPNIMNGLLSLHLTWPRAKGACGIPPYACTKTPYASMVNLFFKDPPGLFCSISIYYYWYHDSLLNLCATPTTAYHSVESCDNISDSQKALCQSAVFILVTLQASVCGRESDCASVCEKAYREHTQVFMSVCVCVKQTVRARPQGESRKWRSKIMRSVMPWRRRKKGQLLVHYG